MNNKTEQSKIQEVAVVALGSFNPRIFHPNWFSGNELIRKEDAQDADIKIINNDAAIFSTSWFALKVFRERFSIESGDPAAHLTFKDLVTGSFKILEHTPVKAFGFNSSQHINMKSEKEWHGLGDSCAPKGFWKKVLDKPGLRTLVIEGKRAKTKAKRIQIRVEPSQKEQPGVFVHINEHYTICEENESPPKNSALRLMGTVQNSWSAFLDYSKKVAEDLIAEHTDKREKK